MTRLPIKDDNLCELNLSPQDRPSRGLDGRFACHVGSCKRHFPTARAMISHFVSHHRKFLFYCRLCSTSFKSVQKFQKHGCRTAALAHREFSIDPRLLEDPKSSTPCRSKIEREVSPIRRATFSCGRCTEVVSSRKELAHHMRNFHFDFARPTPVVNKNYTCEICYNDFTGLQVLVTHIKEFHAEHNGTDPVTCPQCHKENIPEKKLAIHLR